MERIAICAGESEGLAKVLTCKGSGKVIGAAIVHISASGWGRRSSSSVASPKRGGSCRPSWMRKPRVIQRIGS
jgi:hypothetical protein